MKGRQLSCHLPSSVARQVTHKWDAECTASKTKNENNEEHVCLCRSISAPEGQGADTEGDKEANSKARVRQCTLRIRRSF